MSNPPAKKAAKKTAKKTAVKRTTKKPESSEYNTIVNAATIEDVRLVESAFSVEPDYFADDDEVEREFSRGISESDVTYAKKENVLSASFEFAIEVQRDQAILLKCRARYIVFFSFIEEVDKEAAVFFAKRTGRNAAYPYFRQYVAAQSWASGAELPILPILKSGPPKK